MPFYRILVMERVLLLNITYEPLKVIDWKKAVTLLCLGKVEVLKEYNREIRSVSFTLKLPSVVRLLQMIRRPKSQYCGNKYPTEDLTYDHVIPKSRGGRTQWENIVTCCVECNRKKGGRTPHEASMRLVREPTRPSWVPAIRITIGFKQIPENWRDYLYWNVEIVE
jgi:5-methylcytosine-specific restriction endonuclease McrA